MDLRRRLQAVVTLLCVLFWISNAVAASYMSKRVVVHLNGGGKLIGKVIAEKPDGSIQVQVSGGAVWLKPERIDKVIVKRPPEEEFVERAAKCKTADDWVKVARWCGLGDVRLTNERERSLKEAIKLDPDHEGANKELGNIKVDGKWYPEAEGNTLLGKVEVDGKWYPPAEAKRIQREKELRGSNKYLRGLLQQERERRGIPWPTAKVIDREHYKVKCNSTEEVANRYADIMEALNEAYTEIFPEQEFPRYSREKGSIYIFRNNDEFLDFTLMSRGVGGFFSFADRAVRAYHGSFGVTGSTEMVLAHEATHQFQYRIMKDMRSVPTWLIEGMAVYYGDGTEISRRKIELHKIPRDRLHTLQQAIDTRRYTNLKKLIRIPQGRFGGQFYDHAWGVIYWCLQGERHKAHNGEGQVIWDKYLKHVSRDLPKFPDILTRMRTHFDDEAEYFQNLIVSETGYESVKDWEEDYKEFILGLKLEPLGKWAGLTWDGSAKVGIKMKFPKGLKRVEEKSLRQGFREAAAAASRDGSVRMWITVDPNWAGGVAGVKESFLRAYLAGFFKSKDKEPPKVDNVKINDAIPMSVVTFKGKLARRRESSTFVVNDRSKKGSSKKKKSPKKSSEESSKGSGGSADEPELNIKVALHTTDDKIYLFALVGPEAPFSKVEPQFDRALESVKLNF